MKRELKAGQLWPVEDVLSEVLNLIKGDG